MHIDANTELEKRNGNLCRWPQLKRLVGQLAKAVEGATTSTRPTTAAKVPFDPSRVAAPTHDDEVLRLALDEIYAAQVRDHIGFGLEEVQDVGEQTDAANDHAVVRSGGESPSIDLNGTQDVRSAADGRRKALDQIGDIPPSSLVRPFRIESDGWLADVPTVSSDWDEVSPVIVVDD